MKWYVLQVYSGSETRVSRIIEEGIEKKELKHLVEEIQIPTQDSTQTRYGKKSNVQKQLIRGYVFIKMELNDELLFLIKSIQQVTQFLGQTDKNGQPFPVSEEEMEKMFNLVSAKNSATSKNQVHFEIGEDIKITSGSFASFTGVIQEVEEEKSKLKVSVSIFGRMTKVELEYNQVEKIKD